MSRSRNILVGVFLIGGVLLFALGLFLIGNRRMLFTDSFHVYAEFARLAGLANGAKVRVGGMDAGEVVEITVPPGPSARFRVKVRVVEKLHPLVRPDSVATIQNDGIVGNKFIQIDPGTEAAGLAADGSTIRSQEPFDLSDLMQDLRETIGIANRTIMDVKGEVEEALTAITDTAQTAQQLVGDAGRDVKLISAAGARISEDISEIIEDIRAGKGSIGKMLKDDDLYSDLRGVTSDLSQVSGNIRSTTDDVREMTAELKSKQVMEEISKTVRNVQELTRQVNATLAEFQTKSGESGLTTELRETLTYARETMANMAENTEALKRNWFFRGYYKARGFYDLDSVSLDDYRSGEFGRGRQTLREWLPQPELFSTTPDGTERLTAAGREKIDEVMARFLLYPRDSIIMVEGYASEGSSGKQFLNSRARGMAVRGYLIKKYHLESNHIGIMPMGAVESRDDSGKYWDGVALVLFYKGDGPVREGKK